MQAGRPDLRVNKPGGGLSYGNAEPSWIKSERGFDRVRMPGVRGRLELEALGRSTEMSALPPSSVCAESFGCVAARQANEDGAGAALRQGRSGLSATIFPGCPATRDGAVMAQPNPALAPLDPDRAPGRSPQRHAYYTDQRLAHAIVCLPGDPVVIGTQTRGRRARHHQRQRGLLVREHFQATRSPVRVKKILSTKTWPSPYRGVQKSSSLSISVKPAIDATTETRVGGR